MADRAQAPRGDTVYCHECQHEWPRAEHGFRCPRCTSEFVEVVEEENDPRQILPGDGHPHFPTDTPFPDGHHHHHHFHTPSEDTIMGSVQAIHYGDDSDPARPAGSVRYTSVIYRTAPPTNEPPQPTQEPRDTGAHSPFPDFQQMMQSLMGGPRGDPSPDHTAGTALHSPLSSDQPGSSHFGLPDEPSAGRRSFQVLGTRTTYVPNVRLAPRDANNAQPQAQPVDGLAGIIQTLYHDLYGAELGQGPEVNDPPPRPALNPLMAVFGGFIHPRDSADADVVYSQEALDGVISQLMEQHSGSNAPGPASDAAIASLPRIAIDLKMLGDTGKAECTICMDDVPVGQFVMSLPCGHWFHEACGTAWLKEHNTCPICRKGISANQDGNHHHHHHHHQPQGTPPHATPPPSNVEPWRWTSPQRPSAPSRASTGGSNGDRSGLGTTTFTTTIATTPDGTPGAGATTTITTTTNTTENGQPILLANGRPRQPLVLPPPIHSHYPPEINFMLSSGPPNNDNSGVSDPLAIASGSGSSGSGGGGGENRRTSPGIDPPRRRLVRGGGGGSSTSFLGGIGPVAGNHGGDNGNGGGITDRLRGLLTGGNGNGNGNGGGGGNGNGGGGGRGGNGDVGSSP